jgi:phosphoribosylformylglycinamidine synthase subunit PurQ / glutaminase
MATPQVLILRSPGTNCDLETQYAFEQAGARVERIHIQRLRHDPALLQRFQIFVIPGGFSYGDDVAAGKILANQLQHYLGDALRKFRDKENLILGVCNGFQALLKSGLLIQPDEDGPVATLTANSHGYQDRWVHLKTTSTKCVFLTGIEQMEIPMAHGEGRFAVREQWIGQGLEQSGQVVLKYVDAGGMAGGYPVNPNGSLHDIAGLCDASGRVLGLMPHPERHAFPLQHPRWTREGLKATGDGFKLFQNAVEYFRVR